MRPRPLIRAGNADLDDAYEDADTEEMTRAQELTAKERRLVAKRKRIALLDQLLKDLDSLAFVELVTIYYLEHVRPCNLNIPDRYTNMNCVAAPSSGSQSEL
jgi:hypothetical protein